MIQVEVEGRVLVGKKPTSPAGERFVVPPSFGSVVALVLSTLTSGKARARALEGVLRLNGDLLMDGDDCLDLAARLRHARQDDLRAVGSGFGLRLDEEARTSLEAFTGFLEDCGGFGFEMPETERASPPTGICSTCFEVLIAQNPSPDADTLLVLNPLETALFVALCTRAGGDAVSLPQIDRFKFDGNLVLSQPDTTRLGGRLVAWSRRRGVRLAWLVEPVEDFYGGRGEAEDAVCGLLLRAGKFLKRSGGVSGVRMPSSESRDG